MEDTAYILVGEGEARGAGVGLKEVQGRPGLPGATAGIADIEACSYERSAVAGDAAKLSCGRGGRNGYISCRPSEVGSFASMP